MHAIAIISLWLAGLSALVIIVDLLRGHRQHMMIMNVVWPITALYAGPLALWAYFKIGRLSSHRAMMQAQQQGTESPAKRKPFWQTVALATTHCGSGCALGDLLVEGTLILFPLTLWGREIFAAWAIDFVAAFCLGIVFQYFTIKPMRNLSAGQALIAALKADALSLTAWQVGMYGWMAIVTFLIVEHPLNQTGPVFWFMMQVAMLLGFAVSYPVNWWLVRVGIKEKM